MAGELPKPNGPGPEPVAIGPLGKYRTNGASVEYPIYCQARGHLARVGQPSIVGLVRGNLPEPAELDRIESEQRPVCPVCQLYWQRFPALLRPAHPAEV